MNAPEIGIVDTRNIVKTIKETYELDFSDYALTSIKRRFERIILLHGLKHADNLINKIKDNPDFFENILKDILVETTEMFRDPSLWRWLRDVFFAKERNIKSNFKIWLPNCVGGDELFSLAILLNETGLDDKVKTIATSLSEQTLDIIKSGKFSLKKIESSAENYKRFMGSSDFEKYYKADTNFAYRDTSLIENVEFKKTDLIHGELPVNNDLVLFRNHFIYYNQTLQDRISKRIYDSLNHGGHLIIGIKETLGRHTISNDFVVVNKFESVYKKK